jgi:outer membrane protein assembly factor BamB
VKGFRKLGRRCAVLAVLGMIVAGAASASAAVVQPHVTQTWQTNGRVTSMKVVGNIAYIGGKFTSVRPAGAAPGTGEVARNHVAAVNVATGSLLPWDPDANGVVQAIAVNGKTAYLGGSFTQVGGKSHPRLAAVNLTTGAVNAAWKPTADAQVMTLTLNTGILYAGGQFTTVNASGHPYFAALVAATGAIDSGFGGTADAAVTASTMTANHTRLVIGGDFTHVNGSAQNHIAALNPASGSALAWAAHTSYSIVDLAADANGVYAAGLGGGGTFAAFNPATGALRWQDGTDGNVQAIAAVGGEVYAGGHYGNYCGPQGTHHTCPAPLKRLKLVAVDAVTGAVQPWAPSVNSVLGVFSLGAANGGLVAGGDFTRIAGTTQQGFARFAP